MATREHGLRPGEEVRPRGLGAGRRALARGQLVLELPRLPGPPDGDPLPAGAGREAGARPHAQRSGLALARVVAAILETYQQPDGSIRSRRSSGPYLGRETIERLPDAGRAEAPHDDSVRPAATAAPWLLGGPKEEAGPRAGRQVRRPRSPTRRLHPRLADRRRRSTRRSSFASARRARRHDRRAGRFRELGSPAGAAAAGLVVFGLIFLRHVHPRARVLPVLLGAQRADARHAPVRALRRQGQRRRQDLGWPGRSCG